MPAKFLLSPTETGRTVGNTYRPGLSDFLADDAMVSTIPELKGADILLYSTAGLIGWQRKEIPTDFIGSMTDGRMARSIALMKSCCAFQRIIGEGKFRYYPDKTIDMGRYKGGKPIKTRFSKKHVVGMINDIEFVHGIIIDWTENLSDTADYLRGVRSFLSTSTHTGLFRRPSAKGLWNVPTSKDIELWLLQSFPGIGPSTADAIIQHFGGEVPLKWACTFEELCKVKNVTRSKAVELWNYLPTSAPLPADVSIRLATRSTTMEENFKLTYGVEFSNMRNKLRR